MSSFLVFVFVVAGHMQTRSFEFPDLAQCAAAAVDARKTITARRDGSTMAVFCSPMADGGRRDVIDKMLPRRAGGPV